MNRFILSLALTLCIFTGFAQKKPVQQAGPEKFAATITAADLKKHLYIIAGKEMEGRETGTEGQRKAAAYIEAQFKKMGLKPGAKDGYLQFYPIQQDSLVEAGITLNGDAKPWSIYRHFAPSMTGSSNSVISGESVVFAGYGISTDVYDDYKGLDVNGKIVMINEGEPMLNDTAYLLTGNRRRSDWNSNSPKIRNAIQKGALALLIINRNFPRRPPSANVRGRMYTNFDAEQQKLNVFFISDSLAGAICGSAEKLAAAKESIRSGKAAGFSNPAKISLLLKKFDFNIRASNVLGIIPGTDKKDEYLVITAHYDHLGKKDSVIWYGADDDGSGTVSIMELAEAFMKAKTAGQGPRRTILFMAVSGEEKGLWGSDYYTRNPVYPLAQTTADLNIDMIGRIDKAHATDSAYCYLIGDNKLSSELRGISEGANEKYTKLKLDYKYNDPNDPERIYYRSDHYNFAKNKIPIIFYFNGVHPDYHRPTDTPDKISYDLMAQRARLVFYTAWEIANRNEKLKVDRNER